MASATLDSYFARLGATDGFLTSEQFRQAYVKARTTAENDGAIRWGSVSDAEIAAKVRDFGMLDFNRDGRVGVDEFRNELRRTQPRRAPDADTSWDFRNYDRNGDGKVTMRDYIGRLPYAIDFVTVQLWQSVIDTNDDGALSPAELDSWLKAA